jgi:hypothetical protein
VLLIGDSISSCYTLPVREALEGKFNVHHPIENCRSTTYGVATLAEWLGQSKWDVIHFNFGLHDLKIVDNLPDGNPAVQPAEYEENLRLIVTDLKETGAKLIFATTTPVPDEQTRIKHQVDLYNRIALKIMGQNHVEIDDLHSAAINVLSHQIKGDHHFDIIGTAVLAKAVVQSIQAALGE